MSGWQQQSTPGFARRHLVSRLFRLLCGSLTLIGVAFLIILLINVVIQGYEWLDFDFLNSFSSRRPQRAGIKAALFGTLWLIALTALLSIPLGVSSAIYLEEYSPKSRLSNFIEVNIANLAGVPSIVYGMLGLTVFVRSFGLGRSLFAGSLTMTLLVLPVIITASREALRAVPNSLRLASFGLGATRWQTVRHHVLPAAIPGILTGVILSLSRAIGETAPLLMLGAVTFITFTPSSPIDEFTVLPIQIFNWASRPQADFHGLGAAAIVVLLSVLLLMNAIAVTIRWRSQRKTP
jgi:phosphate transport system permease protein